MQRLSLLRSRGRGFTLVELMITVAIVGIVAAIALYGFQKYQRSAAAGEARAMLQSIRGAEDAFKAETLGYMTCPAGPGTSLDPAAIAYYPRSATTLSTPGATDGSHKASWGGFAGEACWRTLNVNASGPVKFSYAVASGNPGAGLSVTGPAGVTNWPFTAFDSNSPWFVAAAIADQDADGKLSILWTSSRNGDVGVWDDTE